MHTRSLAVLLGLLPLQALAAPPQAQYVVRVEQVNTLRNLYLQQEESVSATMGQTAVMRALREQRRGEEFLTEGVTVALKPMRREAGKLTTRVYIAIIAAAKRPDAAPLRESRLMDMNLVAGEEARVDHELENGQRTTISVTLRGLAP